MPQSSKKNKQGNLVMAEAPDADKTTEQGYVLPTAQNGLAQSPVNIKTNQVNESDTHSVALYYNKSHEELVNLGHTVQVNYDEGNIMSFDNKDYIFRQFHFHTPSEHLIDGITYPMEMHMVHTLAGQKEGETPVYCVIGVLFKEGKENPFIDEFIESIPQEEGEVKEVKNHYIDINDLLDQADDLSYYHYQGSLTTPPYTETVTWLIIKQVLEASSEQIEILNRLEGNNARHVQALYNREVDAD